MPQYGSRLSSALYIRGIGSRINTPSVGLYVDDVPVAEKSEYTMNLLGLDRIDIIRGPQGSLYGRNAMGGIIRMYTQNPFQQQGTDIAVSAASRTNRLKTSVITHQRMSDRVAFSLGGFYETDRGLWHNDSLDKRVGGSNAFGFKGRLMVRPAQGLLLDWNAAYEYSDEEGYPYFYDGTPGAAQEPMPQAVGRITANRQGKYRRGLFTTSMKAAWDAPLFTVSSVTGFHNLGDRMFMDQDFIYKDYYSMEQRQKANTLSEEISIKSRSGRRWEWVGGVFGLWEALRTQSPVTFYGDGVDMLNNAIARNMPTPTVTINNPRTGQPVTQAMPMALSIVDPYFGIPANFHTPILNGALFFQGTLHDFLLPRVSLTLGIRLDHERQEMSYRGGKPVHFNFSMPSHQIDMDMETTTLLRGKIKDDHTSLLPKAALQYDFKKNRGNLYLTVSKGQRAGGYNIQMFSDVLSSVMQNDMMQLTKDYLDETMLQHAQQMPAMSDMFLAIKQAIDNNIPIGQMPDIQKTVTYKPEYCWNYEAGTHLNLLDKRLMADLSVFFMDIRNQQISRFVSSGLGRMMVNAGRSHSCGMEMSLLYTLLDNRLSLRANYGFTHSEFRRYDSGDANYKGNNVPFIPRHNASFLADYTLPVNSPSIINSITLGVNATGLGRIWWDEGNTASQHFYGMLGAHACLHMKQCDINLWGSNLTNAHYRTFQFDSANRSYYQKGLPLQLGIDLNVHL